MSSHLNYKSRNVNSKNIEREIDNFVSELLGGSIGLIDLSDPSHRSMIIELIEDGLKEFDDKIDRCKVMCDARNNRKKDMKQGKYTLTIQFCQKDCLNVTEMSYTANLNPDDNSDDFDEEFVLNQLFP